MPDCRRIALWCTPRTVSTAVMRAFAERGDCTCVDEPLYAWYLEHTGRVHPLQAEVLASQPADWREVYAQVLLGPCATAVHFAKHMAHHTVGVDLEPLADLCFHAFLIRDPREMLASFVRDLDRITPQDTGYQRQAELFRYFRQRTGAVPLVVESRALLTDPQGTLAAFCEAAGVSFTERMLSWEAGRHPCFGVWAPHWYASVERSTGFQPWKPKTAPFPTALEPLLAWAQPFYEELYAHRLQVV